MTPADQRWTRENWPAEVLRRSVEAVRAATEGTRHDELIGAAARVADHVAAGDHSRPQVEAELMAAAAAVGLDGKRVKEAQQCITFGLGKGVAENAWYPDTGRDEPIVRRFRWLGGRILTLTVAPRRRVLAELPVVPCSDRPLSVTWFPSMKVTAGSVDLWTWPELAEAIAEPKAWPPDGKAGLPLWSWTEFEGHDRGRRPDGLEENGKERTREPMIGLVHALALDYDDEDAWSCELMSVWWGAVHHLAHTTAHHKIEKPIKGGSRPARPRGRVILALSRPVSESEHEKLATWVLASGRGRIGEAELRNPRRAYFVPSSAPGGYESRYNEGGALDVEAILDAAAADAVEQDTVAPEEAVLELLDHTPKGLIKPTLRNIVTVLDADTRHLARYTRCTFSARDLLDGRAVTDADEVELACWLDAVYTIDSSIDRIHHAVTAVAARHSVHPVRAYLDPLEWDGEERLPVWLVNWAGVEPHPLAEVYGMRWMIAAVARVYDPGCQADSALVFSGPKGLGKTSTLRILGGPWHSESTIAIGERDGYQQLQGVWIYELGEMSALRKSEIEAVKQFITARVDRYRPPYGRNVVEIPRQCVFAGTTNDATFLSEADRRWWVMQVTRRANLASLLEHRDQMWAEAVVRYRRHETWHLTGEDERAQVVDVEQYRHRDPWEELIFERYAATYEITVREILVQLLRRDKTELPDVIYARATKNDQMRVARILREQGRTKHESAGRISWRMSGTFSKEKPK